MLINTFKSVDDEQLVSLSGERKENHNLGNK
jgi:hypothetical protein